MVSQLLSLCGVYVGPQDELLEATTDNPEGYWEDERFVTLNDRILEALGGSWHQPPEMEPGYVNRPELDVIRQEARVLIDSNAPHDPWGWKDPRNSLTLAFWQSLIPDLKVVICLRDPIEVAQSLANRQYMHLQHLTFRESVDLWRRYYDQLTRATTPSNAIVSQSATYFYDPGAELQRVLDFLGLKIAPSVVTRALSAVKPGLRRSVVADYDAVEAGLPAEVKELYRRLLNDSGPVFQHLTADGTFQLKAKYTDLDTAVERIKHLERYFSDSAETIEEIHRLQQEIKLTHQHADDLQALIDGLREDLENMRNTRWWKLHDTLIGLMKTFHLRR